MLGLLEIKLNNHVLYQRDFLADDPFVHTALHFHTPNIKFLRWEQNDFNDWYRELGIRAPTTLIWHKSDFYWSFNLSIFGFGISIAYQNGY